MIKLIATVERLPSISREEFLRVWREEHAPLVLELPGVRGYRQNHAIEFHRPWPWDGVVELWFDDVDSVRTAFASTAGVTLRDHEKGFVRSVETVIVEEHEVLRVV